MPTVRRTSFRRTSLIKETLNASGSGNKASGNELSAVDTLSDDKLILSDRSNKPNSSIDRSKSKGAFDIVSEYLRQHDMVLSLSVKDKNEGTDSNDLRRKCRGRQSFKDSNKENLRGSNTKAVMCMRSPQSVCRRSSKESFSDIAQATDLSNETQPQLASNSLHNKSAIDQESKVMISSSPVNEKYTIPHLCSIISPNDLEDASQYITTNTTVTSTATTTTNNKDQSCTPNSNSSLPIHPIFINSICTLSDNTYAKAHLNNTHNLIDSTALVGSELVRNCNHLTSSTLAHITTAIHDTNEIISHRSYGKRRVDLTKSNNLNQSNSTQLFPFNYNRSKGVTNLSTRHPFLHSWEQENDMPCNRSWQSKRNAYTTYLLATEDSVTINSNNDLANVNDDNPNNNKICRLSDKRSTYRSRDFLSYSKYPNMGGELVSNEIATQDRIICELEPCILGHRWNSNSKSDLTDTHLLTKQSCVQLGSYKTDQETIILWT